MRHCFIIQQLLSQYEYIIILLLKYHLRVPGASIVTDFHNFIKC